MLLVLGTGLLVGATRLSIEVIRLGGSGGVRNYGGVKECVRLDSQREILAWYWSERERETCRRTY